MENTKTIAERLFDLGYTYDTEEVDYAGRRAIYAIGQEGYAIDYLNAKEAAHFCAFYENVNSALNNPSDQTKE